MQQVPSHQTVSYPIQNTINSQGEVLHTAVLGLERAVTKDDIASFHQQKMTIKCAASIYTAYYKVSTITVSVKAKRKLKRRRDDSVTDNPDNDQQKGDFSIENLDFPHLFQKFCNILVVHIAS